MSSDIEDGELLSSDDEITEEIRPVADIKQEPVEANADKVSLKSNKRTYHFNNDYKVEEVPAKVCRGKKNIESNGNDNSYQESRNRRDRSLIKKELNNTKENVLRSGQKLVLCKYYAVGECKHRDTCLFMHSDFPCVKFHDPGAKCQHGTACKYSHAPATDQTLIIVRSLIVNAQSQKVIPESQMVVPPMDEDLSDRPRCLLPTPQTDSDSTNLTINGLHNETASQNNTSHASNYGNSTNNGILNGMPQPPRSCRFKTSRFSDLKPNAASPRAANWRPLGTPIVRPDITQPPPSFPVATSSSQTPPFPLDSSHIHEIKHSNQPMDLSKDLPLNLRSQICTEEGFEEPVLVSRKRKHPDRPWKLIHLCEVDQALYQDLPLSLKDVPKCLVFDPRMKGHVVLDEFWDDLKTTDFYTRLLISGIQNI